MGRRGHPIITRRAALAGIDGLAASCTGEANLSEGEQGRIARVMDADALGRQARLWYGGLSRDSYERAIAHVIARDEISGDVWLNGLLARQGPGRVCSYPDNSTRARRLLSLENEARAARCGLRSDELAETESTAFGAKFRVDGPPVCATRGRSGSHGLAGRHWTSRPAIRHQGPIAEALMIAEHAYAVLIRDIPEAGLVVGDEGVVVQVHARPGETQPVGYMLELFTVDGGTIETVSVPADAVRPSTDSGRVHVRPVAA